MLTRKTILILMVSTLVLTGCRSSKPVTPSFFLVEYPSDPPPTDTVKVLPYVLELVEVNVNPAYASPQIAVREGEQELQYFVNNQWAVRPAQSFAGFIEQYFADNRVFTQTQTRFWNLQPDYRLQTIVHNLEILRDRRDFYARLHLEFRLETADGELIERYVKDNRRLLESRDLNLFTIAVNNMFFEELNYFTGKIYFGLSPAE